MKKKIWGLGLLGLALFFLAVIIFGKPYGLNPLGEAQKFLGSIFFVDSITDKQIIDKYLVAKNSGEGVRVLIAPGHDSEVQGTEFDGTEEADLNLELATDLYNLMKSDNKFEVFITRNENGYLPEFVNFFSSERKNIEKFWAENFLLMDSMVKAGAVKLADGVSHNYASNETSIKLSGINYWANKNKIDVAVSIYFNDYGGRRNGQPGRYSGYAIYVPEDQYSNSKASQTIAKYVSKSLSMLLPTSDLPKEGGGVVQDQELISVGANNSLDPASLLIEYGYIYENQFINPSLRPTMLKELAYLTYNGLKNFLEGRNDANANQTTILPFRFERTLTRKDEGLDVLALQRALVSENLYPPLGFSKNDCPISGTFGACTEKSVIDFQDKYGIVPAEGMVGPMTLSKLNQLYGIR